MNDLISILSEIRSQYNCFDPKEEPYYRALSEAIDLASAQKMQLSEEDAIKGTTFDCISRQAAIEALGEEPEVWSGEDEYEQGLNNQWHYDITAIKAVPSAGQWIPVTERLPEEIKKVYWVCTDAQSQHECRWTNNRYGLVDSDEWGWSIFDIPQYTKVVAWMPLPEAYHE